MSQMHLIGQHILENTASNQRMTQMQQKPRNSQTGSSGLGIHMFWFSQLKLATQN
jgi:hypothetical protein